MCIRDSVGTGVFGVRRFQHQRRRPRFHALHGGGKAWRVLRRGRRGHACLHTQRAAEQKYGDQRDEQGRDHRQDDGQGFHANRSFSCAARMRAVRSRCV